MPKISMIKRFTSVGRMQATQLVKDIQQAGGDARIDMTWEDVGAGIQTETVLSHSKSLNMWYQSLTPADINQMNAGAKPKHYDAILASATH